MEINEKSIKIWSTIGSRATLGIAALDLAKEIDNLMVLTCDVSTSAGLDRFRKTYPEKYLDLGIAEQNMIGVAAGLASENFNVITTTFAPFQTMRCCEQIKVNLGYMGQKICMVGIASGLVLGTLGYTHCCIEDVSIMRSIPGITVVSPADCGATVKAVLAAIENEQSVYIRLTGGAPNPAVYLDDFDFTIGKANILRETDGLFLHEINLVSKNYPKIAVEDYLIDNFAQQLYKNPERFNKKVLVSTNLFMDIISEEASALTGSIGNVYSANFGTDYAMFEPAHGSAPKYKGMDKVNPTATILSAAWMLRYLGDSISADAIFNSTEKVITDNKYVTYDLGGTAKTSEMTSEIIKHL